MKAKKRLSVILVGLFVFTSVFSNFVFAESTSSVKIELDKTQAAVGEIIKASVVVDNISGFAGYQVNLKYDPTVLAAVDAETGAAFTNSTKPKDGTILTNAGYGALPVAASNISQGILNFGKMYTSMGDYKASAKAETSGTVAIIGFKVLKAEETSIEFAQTNTMPAAVLGVLLFDWDANKITSGYSIINPPVINHTGATVTSTPVDVTGILATPTPAATQKPEGKSGEIGSSVVSNDGGKVTYKFEQKQLETALEEVVPDSKGIKTAVLPVGGVKGAKVYTQDFPNQALLSNVLSYKINMSTAYATLLIPSNMLKTGTLASEVSGASNVALSVAGADSSSLSEDIKAKIANRPMIDLSLMINGAVKEWSNPESPVKVSIPYTPADAESLEHIVVLQIDNAGKAITVPSGRYNESTRMVTFTATQFGKYAVAYVNKTFTDIKSFSWAKNQIEVLASKGIINGTSDVTFNPQADITRADFMVLLVKALDLSATVDSNFADIPANAYYYKQTGIAKKLGVTTGVGDNKYNPTAKITRQDMMVLITKALMVSGKISSEATADAIAAYNDKAQVASYAVNGVATLVKEGIVVGSNNTIKPKGNASRAELAAIVYKIYNK